MSGPLEKLTAVFEDLFEAEDALAPDMAPGDLPHDLFSPSTTDPSQPLLSSTVIRRISKYIDQVARPSKRMRLTSTKDIGTPRAMSRTAELDPATLARVLKMLERNVKAGEEADPLKLESAPVRPNDGETASPTKKSKGKSTPKNKGAKGVEDTADGEGERLSPAESASQAVSEQELVDLTVGLDVARDSVLAAEACLAMLSSDRLPRQLYSEELITSCLLAVKNQLTRIIYPFMEAAPGDVLPALLQHLMQRGTPVSQACQGHRSQLTELFLAVSAAFPRMQKMVDADSVAMSDAIVIQAVFIAIGPFFVVEGEPETGGKNKKDNAVLNTLGPSAIRGLRLEALSLIRSVCFASPTWGTTSSQLTPDICEPRESTVMDHRRDPLLPRQALRQQAKGWDVPVSSLFPQRFVYPLFSQTP
jgi:cohesin loading factor subunit SCC2